MAANIGVDDTIPECGVRVSSVTYRERPGSIRCHSGEREQICLRPCFADVLLSHKPTAIDGILPKARFAPDSPLEQRRFELVWGFSCQVVVLGFAESSLFGAGKPFFVPSPAIRFPERAEGVKGPKR